MLLRILKSNQAYNLILFPLVGILLWSVSLITPSSYLFFEGEGQMVLFKPLYKLVQGSAFAQVFIALVILIFIGFLIQRFNSQFGFIRKRTLLPSCYFIILISGLHSLQALHPVYFSGIFLMLALFRCFNAFEKKNTYSNSFDAGLFIGLGSLFYLNTIFIYPAIVLGLVSINKEFSWRNLALTLFGVALPWIFVFSFFFISDKSEVLVQTLSGNILTVNNHIKGDIPLQIYLGFQLLLVIIASLNIIKFYDTKKVSSRKYFVSFFWIFLFAASTWIFVPAASIEIMVLVAFPTTFLASNYFVYLKSRLWGELLFAIFIGLAVYMQFIG